MLWMLQIMNGNIILIMSSFIRWRTSSMLLELKWHLFTIHLASGNTNTTTTTRMTWSNHSLSKIFLKISFTIQVLLSLVQIIVKYCWQVTRLISLLLIQWVKQVLRFKHKDFRSKFLVKIWIAINQWTWVVMWTLNVQ